MFWKCTPIFTQSFDLGTKMDLVQQQDVHIPVQTTTTQSILPTTVLVFLTVAQTQVHLTSLHMQIMTMALVLLKFLDV